MRDEARATLRELAVAVPLTRQVNDFALLAAEARELGVADLVRGMTPDAAWPSKWTTAVFDVLEGRLDEAADLLDEMAIPPYAAFVRMKAAEQLSHAGRHIEADLRLRRALEFWRKVRAERYIRKAEALLSRTA
jgi:hypothetical protein